MTFKEYLKMKQSGNQEPAVNDAAVELDGVAGEGASAQGANDAEASTQGANDAEAGAQGEVEALRDKLLRLHADFDNYRKRVARDHAERVKSANEELIEALLPVLDHIGHAEAMMVKEGMEAAEPYLEGFRMVKNELLRVLEGYGVVPIVATGVAFDANFHEALSALPSEAAAAGDILFEIRKGYLLHGRVLRASQVVVAAEQEGAAAGAPAANVCTEQGEG